MNAVMPGADNQDPLDFNAPRAWRVTITIADVTPPIWRTLLVPESFNFAQLHELIQAAFGWTDSHLHQFILGGLVVGAPEFDDDDILGQLIIEAEEVRLSDLNLYHFDEPKILYEYDFGDSWRHWIAFERVVPMVKGDAYPQLIDGARACPPEDVGALRHVDPPFPRGVGLIVTPEDWVQQCLGQRSNLPDLPFRSKAAYSALLEQPADCIIKSWRFCWASGRAHVLEWQPPLKRFHQSEMLFIIGCKRLVLER